jgi:hypothetical protein
MVAASAAATASTAVSANGAIGLKARVVIL